MKVTPLQPSHGRRGAILYFGVLSMIPLAALVYALMIIGKAFTNEQSQARDEEQALLIADAGIDEAMLALRNGGTGAVGSQAAPAYFGHGLFWVESTPVGNALIQLRSSAMYARGRQSVEALVFRQRTDLLGMAIFSDQDLVVESGSLIDSFDSALGTYASQAPGGVGADGAILESNRSISVLSSTDLHGDAHSGPGYNVDVKSSGSVSGTLQPIPEPRIIPPVVVPAIAPSGSLNTVADQVLAPGDYNFTTLSVGTGTELTIQGPARIVVDDMSLLSNTSLVFDNLAGPIELFISGDFVQASNSTISSTALSAAMLRLNLTGDATQLVEFRSNGDFYGVIYAPDATVDIHSNFEVFGSIIADSVIINSNVNIHYDEALKNIIGSPETYTRATWTKTDFPIPAFKLNRYDPFQLAGLDPAALLLPGDAHQPVVP